MVPRPLPRPREIAAHLSRYVVGQVPAVACLARAAYTHYLGVAAMVDAGDPRPAFGPQHTLLVGPTGTGKSELLLRLAEFLGAPVCFGSATSLVETGYVGQQVDSLLHMLWLAADRDVERAARGIIVLDEVDKIRRCEGTGRDVSGEGVQNALLRMLDGSPFPLRARGEEVLLDTSTILFVAAGAFVGLDALARRRRARGGRVGFAEAAAGAPAEDEGAADVTTEDLIEFGFIPEFIGRFPHVTRLRALASADLVHILAKGQGSALARRRRLFAAHGLELAVTPEGLEAVAGRAVRLDTGARGLERALGSVLAPVQDALPELAERGYATARLVRDAHGEPAVELSAAGDAGEAGARVTPAALLARHALPPARGPAHAAAGGRERGAPSGRPPARSASSAEVRARVELWDDGQITLCARPHADCLVFEWVVRGQGGAPGARPVAGVRLSPAAVAALRRSVALLSARGEPVADEPASPRPAGEAHGPAEPSPAWHCRVPGAPLDVFAMAGGWLLRFGRASGAPPTVLRFQLDLPATACLEELLARVEAAATA